MPGESSENCEHESTVEDVNEPPRTVTVGLCGSEKKFRQFFNQFQHYMLTGCDAGSSHYTALPLSLAEGVPPCVPAVIDLSGIDAVWEEWHGSATASSKEEEVARRRRLDRAVDDVVKRAPTVDCILHKMTLGDSDNVQLVQFKRQVLARYCDYQSAINCKTITMIDPIESVDALESRSGIHRLLCKVFTSSDRSLSSQEGSSATITWQLPTSYLWSAPHQQEVQRLSADGPGELIPISELPCPCLIKTEQSSGHGSHNMRLCSSAADLVDDGTSNTSSSQVLVKFPRFVQNFVGAPVSHESEGMNRQDFLKVYVLGELVSVLPRVMRFADRDIDTQQATKRNVTVTANVPEFLRQGCVMMAARIRSVTGLSLFGFDVVVDYVSDGAMWGEQTAGNDGSVESEAHGTDTTGERAVILYIVDLNYFPSYTHVDNLNERMLRHVATACI